METVILINPAGGSAGEDSCARVTDALRAAGIDAKVEQVAGEKLAKRANTAVAAGARRVIVGGGDGTLSTVAGVLAGSDAALGILPLGTLNHLARDLGISVDLNEAAAVIAAGAKRQIDVASLNHRIFVNNSAIGLYPLFVADREGQQQRLGRSKRLAMLVAGVRTLARFHHHRLTLTVNDRRSETIETPLLFVGNNDYRLDLGGAGTRQNITDGRLCVMALRRMGRLGFFAAMLRALAGRPRATDMVSLDGVERLQLASRRSTLSASCDGETLHLAPPLDYRIIPAALTVFVPR